MNNNFKEQLKKEIIEIGAEKFETEELLSVVSHLSNSSNISRSNNFKRRFLDKLIDRKVKRKTFLPKWVFYPSFAAVLLLFIGIPSIVKAQSSLPDDSFYPIKRFTENVMVSINSEFRAEILRRRSDEIKEMAEKNKDPHVIKNTIKEYNNELKENKIDDSIKIRESRKNLEEAKVKLDENDKREIDQIIIKLKNKRNEESEIEKEVKGGKNEDKKEESKKNKDKDKD